MIVSSSTQEVSLPVSQSSATEAEFFSQRLLRFSQPNLSNRIRFFAAVISDSSQFCLATALSTPGVRRREAAF